MCNVQQAKDVAAQMLAYFSAATPYTEYTNIDGTIKRLPNRLPTLQRFANDALGVSSQTLHRWAHATKSNGDIKHPELAEAYERCKDYKHDVLLNGALMGQYVSPIAILELKNHHAYTDKLEHGIGNTDGKPFETKEVGNKGLIEAIEAQANVFRKLGRSDAQSDISKDNP